MSERATDDATTPPDSGSGGGAGLLAKLRRKGLRGVAGAFKRRVYKRMDLAIYERDCRDTPVPDIPRTFCKGVRFEEATLEHLDVVAANFPWKKDWYRERLETPGYHCSLAMLGDEVIGHNWLCTIPHRDPEMKCVVDPGPRGGYWFEGWTRAEWRGKGVGSLGMHDCLANLAPKYGLDTCMTMIEWSNRSARRLHHRYDFREVASRTHLRLGPLRWTSRPRALTPDEAAARRELADQAS